MSDRDETAGSGRALLARMRDALSRVAAAARGEGDLAAALAEAEAARQDADLALIGGEVRELARIARPDTRGDGAGMVALFATPSGVLAVARPPGDPGTDHVICLEFARGRLLVGMGVGTEGPCCAAFLDRDGAEVGGMRDAAETPRAFFPAQPGGPSPGPRR